MILHYLLAKLLPRYQSVFDQPNNPVLYFLLSISLWKLFSIDSSVMGCKPSLSKRTNDLPLSEGLIESKNDDECQNLQVLCSTKSQQSSVHQDTINPKEMKSGLEEEEEEEDDFPLWERLIESKNDDKRRKVQVLCSPEDEEEEKKMLQSSSCSIITNYSRILQLEVKLNLRGSYGGEDRLGRLLEEWTLSSLKKSDSGVKKGMQFIRNGARLLRELITNTHGKINPMTIFSLKELENATNNFNPDRIVGSGLSCVYKGIIEDRHVAVKKYFADGFFEMFVKEVVSLSLIKHRNVVKLLGWCLELGSPILVYDLLPNQNLRQKICSTQLLWKERLRIAIEVADALAYMHLALEVPITHGLVSSRSVLVNELDSAKLCTFGFSTVRKKPMNPDNESNLRNTTAKCKDVHFFGLMMVELLTENLLTEERHLITNEEIPNSLDKNLCSKDMLQIKACSNLAVRCVSLGLFEKPSIKEIVQELRRIARFQHPNVENGDLLPTIYSIVEELRTTHFPRFQSLFPQQT